MATLTYCPKRKLLTFKALLTSPQEKCFFKGLRLPTFFRMGSLLSRTHSKAILREICISDFDIVRVFGGRPAGKIRVWSSSPRPSQKMASKTRWQCRGHTATNTSSRGWYGEWEWGCHTPCQTKAIPCGIGRLRPFAIWPLLAHLRYPAPMMAACVLTVVAHWRP